MRKDHISGKIYEIFYDLTLCGATNKSGHLAVNKLQHKCAICLIKHQQIAHFC